MNIIFCHGVMDPEYDWAKREYNPSKGWKYWLQFQIEKDRDVVMQMPAFPHAHVNLMKYDEWERIMNFQDINPDTVLVGHSAGGGFILKYMATHPELHVRQIVLVAPYCDTENYQPFGFYRDFNLSNDIINRTSMGADIMISDDDDFYIINSFDKIVKEMPAIRVHKFSGRGHFICDKLPEVLEIIK